MKEKIKNWIFKMLGRDFLIAVAFIVAMFYGIHAEIDTEILKWIVIGAIALSALNILGHQVIDAIATAIRNVKVNVGAQANVQGNIKL